MEWWINHKNERLSSACTRIPSAPDSLSSVQPQARIQQRQEQPEFTLTHFTGKLWQVLTCDFCLCRFTYRPIHTHTPIDMPLYVCVCAQDLKYSRLYFFRLGFYFFIPQLPSLLDNSLSSCPFLSSNAETFYFFTTLNNSWPVWIFTCKVSLRAGGDGHVYNVKHSNVPPDWI